MVHDRPSLPLLFVLSVAAPALLAQGGPPLRTDDPATPGPGVWEVNLAVAGEWAAGGASIEAPLLDFNYGIGERFQLKFELPWMTVLEEGEAARSGLGNSTIGLKWRFLDQAFHQVDLSLYPQLEFNNPTSSAERGIVDRGTAFILPVQLERAIGPLSLNPEVGYIVTESDEAWLYGLAAGAAPLEGIELLAEIHGGATADFRDDLLVFQAGGRWALSPRCIVLAAAGRGIRHPRSGEIKLVGYFGVQILFGGGPTGREVAHLGQSDGLPASR
jgi:hypothetical protein